MDFDDTAAYIRHRLRVAGNHNNHFSPRRQYAESMNSPAERQG
ncbi:MAG: hypothetical protein WDA20_08080 [Desulfuromonadales bacterium]